LFIQIAVIRVRLPYSLVRRASNYFCTVIHVFPVAGSQM
jgi:hypothetical protein